MFIINTLVWGQSAIIKGHVSDANNKESLIGATVYLKENSHINDAAGLDGSYNLKNISPGKYTVVVQYFGYVNQEQPATITGSNDVVTLDFKMMPDSTMLKEVHIYGNYDKEGDVYARNLEKNNDYILNIMSAKTMLLLPDITVGDVLQRVSGVITEKSVTGGGKYATIRGIDQRYNYTTINGVKVPSPDYENNYVPMDMFPSEILERLEVIKSLRPDMEGDAIGGVMNLVLKNPPDYRILNAEVYSGYGQYLFNTNFNSFNSSSINSKSPEAINGPSYNATSYDFPTSPFTYNSAKASPDASAGFTYGDRYFNNKLGLILSAIYQNTYSITKAFFLTPSAQPNFGPNYDNPNTPIFDDIENRIYSTQQTRESAHLKLDYNLSSKHKLSFYTTYVGMNQYRSDFKTDTNLGTGSNTWPGTGGANLNYETKVTYENIYNATFQGLDSLAHNFLLDWTGAYTRGFSNTPDWGTLSTQNAYEYAAGNAYYYSGWSGRWWQNTDQDYSGYINLTYKTSIFKQDVKFKVGAMNRDKNRNDEYEDYSLNPISTTTFVTPTNFSDALWQIKGAEAMGSPSDANNYAVQEDITAAYGMVNFDVGPKIEVMGGVRGENTLLSYNTPLPSNINEDYGNIHYIDYLPSGEIKYKITDKQAIRASYFSSITRPNFQELMPYQVTGDYFTEAGNPYLLHTQAQNYDLRYEYFPSPTDQLLAGVFYKNIIDPIEYTLSRYKTSSQYLQPVNDTNKAYDYGFELQVTKYFMEYYGVSANYTFTKSQTTVPDAYYYINSSGAYTNTTVNETRPLQGQADNIGNLSLLYKNPKMGLDLNVSGVYTGKLIAVASPDYGLDMWQQPQVRLDFSFQQRLSKKYKISIFGKVNNILNTPLEIKIYAPSAYNNVGITAYLPNQTGNGLISTILQEKETYGQYYTLGIRYKF